MPGRPPYVTFGRHAFSTPGARATSTFCTVAFTVTDADSLFLGFVSWRVRYGVLFKEGMVVRHPTFGLGRIVLLSWTHAWVYFPDLPGGAEDAVKKLLIEGARMTVASDVTDARLQHVPVKLVNGVLEFPRSTRISHKEAVAYFLKSFPQGFKDPSLIEQELTYKRKAVAAFRTRFGDGRGRDLLRKKKYDEVSLGIDKLFHATNIPAVQEILAVRDGVKNRDAAARFLLGVLDFVDTPGAAAFEGLVSAVDGLPADLGRAAVLTWPIVTLLPFFADPKRFIVLKPSMTKTAAERLFFDLAYDSRPNWSTFERTLAFATSLRELLKPHGAKDFIDVQSFIWVTAGAPAMKRRSSSVTTTD